jgi:hypothetical protein
LGLKGLKAILAGANGGIGRSAAARPFLKDSNNGSVICMSCSGAVEEFMGAQTYHVLKAAVMAT